MTKETTLGLSGRIAAAFQSAYITPLLGLTALLLGLFAVLATPREEEPQINVTMANVIIPFPGASVRDVEQMVAAPAEQVLAGMVGVEHVMSVSNPGMAMVTVQFKVGVPRTEALVRLHDTVNSNNDWLPPGLGVQQPLIKPKGIDDVPIVTLTLHGKTPDVNTYDLERIANSIETELKRVPGTYAVKLTGGTGRSVQIGIDPARMTALGVTVTELRAVLQSANQGLPVGELLRGNQSLLIDTGNFLESTKDVAELIVGLHQGQPVFLREIATISEGPPPQRYVWHADREITSPALTLAITKQPGENAIDVSNAIMEQVAILHNTVIPSNVELIETRNYGTTANDKAQKLIQKLIFATLSVVALVFVALGRREAAIIGVAVGLTLAATLFASWAWGFTLNRVSLFALIFSIGILVDDAIVVIENIHRHQQLFPNRPLSQIIPGAVDEVGGPTILATFTVIAALLPMAFVTGLMGPYMSPIPINASMGMLISLAIAFTLTPWLARLWMGKSKVVAPAPDAVKKDSHLSRIFKAIFHPLLNTEKSPRNRCLLGLGIVLLIVGSLLLPAIGLVQMKMLPFDNKSEFQVIVDMPAGTPVEYTAAALHEMSAYLLTIPEVSNTQTYAGTAAPINFNGLVRQYDLRRGGESGDIQVNLVDAAHRNRQSHAIATDVRSSLVAIGQRYGANTKVVEVPPGPPVLSPIVAQIYGPTEQGRRQIAHDLRAVFSKVEGMVDIDDSSIADAPRLVLKVDRAKAALLGISQQVIADTLHAGLSGQAVTYLHDGAKYPTAAVIQLPADQHGNLDALLQLPVRGINGQMVAIRELVQLSNTLREQTVHHKDLLPVNYVVADMAGKVDSPLYGLFAARSHLDQITVPGGDKLQEYFINTPKDINREYAIKWDGEWQITYETFRDMGIAYGVGLILIYLLVVAHFGSYLTPLIIMAPIPLTIIGVMPGHALLGGQYTATSMIGMIALAGIIVRNSILLVDFIKLQVQTGMPFNEAVVDAAATRAQPIVLTGLAAMLGAFFILGDPIFNGLAISLVFGVLVSTLLTLVVIPLLYYVAYRNKLDFLTSKGSS